MVDWSKKFSNGTRQDKTFTILMPKIKTLEKVSSQYRYRRRGISCAYPTRRMCTGSQHRVCCMGEKGRINYQLCMLLHV